MAMKRKKVKKLAASKRPADAQGYQFKIGQRVTVIAPGSFAARCLGTVSAITGNDVAVRLDHKHADKVFPATDLAAA